MALTRLNRRARPIGQTSPLSKLYQARFTPFAAPALRANAQAKTTMGWTKNEQITPYTREVNKEILAAEGTERMILPVRNGRGFPHRFLHFPCLRKYIMKTIYYKHFFYKNMLGSDPFS
ncbi:MAG: hypothetical protein DU429_04095 [Candidatus Tokpelaia sp.]|nr:MAG: hypothetical protein DU430_06280 [Candidatus Tokpelaia sp.]KAA6207034.1 MAG: hypothetical protein DU429_04095 [Candidatus Tokpelaia sp.]